MSPQRVGKESSRSLKEIYKKSVQKSYQVFQYQEGTREGREGKVGVLAIPLEGLRECTVGSSTETVCYFLGSLYMDKDRTKAKCPPSPQRRSKGPRKEFN